MAATRAEKETELHMLEGVFKEADAAILIDYKGINVPQVTELRAQLRKAKAGYKVVKNTIARRAVKGTNYEQFADQFDGTTAVAYTGEDPVVLAKTITTFMKSVPTMQIKAALVQGQAIKPAQVTELANMPGKPELYAKLLYVMQAPMVNLVRVLNAVPRDLMSVLVQYEDKQKKGEASASPSEGGTEGAAGDVASAAPSQES